MIQSVVRTRGGPCTRGPGTCAPAAACGASSLTTLFLMVLAAQQIVPGVASSSAAPVATQTTLTTTTPGEQGGRGGATALGARDGRGRSARPPFGAGRADDDERGRGRSGHEEEAISWHATPPAVVEGEGGRTSGVLRPPEPRDEARDDEARDQEEDQEDGSPRAMTTRRLMHGGGETNGGPSRDRDRAQGGGPPWWSAAKSSPVTTRRRLASTCSAGVWGSSSGGGGCCTYNGCGKDSGCPSGYTATAHPDDRCGFLWTSYEYFCCTGPVYNACIKGGNGYYKMGCGRRAVGRSKSQCDADCVSFCFF